MNESIRQYMQEIGRKGGQSKSQAKREAAKRNGFKGQAKPLRVDTKPLRVDKPTVSLPPKLAIASNQFAAYLR